MSFLLPPNGICVFCCLYLIPILKIYTSYKEKHRHFAIFHSRASGAKVVTSGEDEDDMGPPRDLGLEAITVTEQDWVISFPGGEHMDSVCVGRKWRSTEWPIDRLPERVTADQVSLCFPIFPALLEVRLEIWIKSFLISEFRYSLSLLPHPPLRQLMALEAICSTDMAQVPSWMRTILGRGCTRIRF